MEHQPIVDALAKIEEGRVEDRVKNLPAVLWEDQFTTKVTIIIMPYQIVYGQDRVLPIELEIPT